jgi:hypothetical protein
MDKEQKPDRIIPSGDHPHIDDDVCISLLHGLLPEEAKDDALDHMASCDPCETLFQKVVAERARLRATKILGRDPQGVPMVTAASDRAALGAQDAAGRFTPGRWVRSAAGAILGRPMTPARGWAGLAAATMAVVAVILVLWPHRDDRNGRLELLPPYTGAQAFRASSDREAAVALGPGLEAYRRRDFDRSVRLLRAAAVTEPMGRVRDAYVASALTWEKRYPEALAVFATISEANLPEPWRTQLLWARQVALEGSGKRAEADSLLRRLALEPGEAGRRAARLLDRKKG